MFKKGKDNNLELTVVGIERKKFRKYTELSRFSISTNKTIPQATHGTVCLRGKQD